MAIKGKGKGKRRGVSTAPKPVYVQPKRPLLSRKGFWIGVGIAVVVAAVTSVTIALLVQHHDNQLQAEKKAEKDIVRSFGTKLDTAIASIGQGSQTAFQPFPNLTTDIDKLKTGDLSDEDAITEAEQVASQAASAIDAVQKINGTSMIGTHTDLRPLVDGQEEMVQALQLYEQVGASMKLAAEASGKERRALVSHTTSLLSTVGEVFNSGYQKLVGLRAQFGIISLTPSTGGAPGTP
jgi:hypothetical protein